MKFLVPKNSNDKRKFLKLNGVTIPVSEANTNAAPFEAGTRERGYRGDYFLDRCKTKQDYSFDVCLQDQEDACAFEGLMQGEGESFPFTDDEYSCKGAAPSDLGGFFVDCEVDGKFQPEYTGATPNGAFTGTTITNSSDIVNTNGDQGNWTVDGGAHTAAVSTLTTSQTPYPEQDGSTGSLLVDIPSTAFTTPAISYARRVIRAAGLASSSTHTISFFYKAATAGLNGGGFYANIISNNISASGATAEFKSFSNGWNRAVFTFVTTGAAAGAVTLEISSANKSGLVFVDQQIATSVLIDAIQVEQGRECVAPFTKTSSTGTQAEFDLSTLKCNSGGATVSFWYKRPSTYPQATSLFRLYEGAGLTLNWGVEIDSDGSGDFTATIRNQIPLNFTTVTASLGALFPDDEWHLFSMTIRNDSGNGPVYAFYVDGGLVEQVNPDPEYTPPWGADSLTMEWTGVDNDSLLSDLQLWPFAVGHTVIGELYQSGISQGCMPQMTMEGHIDKRKTVKVIGRIDDKEYVSVFIDGCWVNNAIRMSAELFEV